MYTRISISLALILSSLATSYGQVTKNYFQRETPYALNKTKDLGLSLGALGLYGLGTHTLRNESDPIFSIDNFDQSDIDRINFLDRGTAGNWSLGAKNAGKIFVHLSSTAIPLGLLAYPGKIEDRATLALMFYQGYYMTGGLVTLTKGLTKRYRPFTYITSEEVNQMKTDEREAFLDDIDSRSIDDSFFSGDAAKTAYGFMFFAKSFNDYFPNSKLRHVVWISSFSAISLQSYFRVKSGKHFPTDVIVGSIVGGAMGYIIPHIHNNEKDAVSLGLGPNGISLVHKF